MSKFSKNIGRLGVLTAMTVSLLKCNAPANTQKTEQENDNIAEKLLAMFKEHNVSIDLEQVKGLVNAVEKDHNFNKTTIQKFIDILKEKNILKEENGKIVANEEAFIKTENGKVILNTNIVKIEELKKAISQDNLFKAIDVNVLKETLKTFFTDNFQTEIDDIVDDLANFLSECQYFNISYIEKEYEDKEAIKNVFVKTKDDEIGFVLPDDKKINEKALKEGELTDEIKKEIEEKLEALLKKETPQKNDETKKEEEPKTLKTIDSVAKEKNITYNNEKGFTDQDWKTICSGNKFSFEDIKNHLPEKTVFKMRETVMNIIKSMDDKSADNILEITKFFNNFKFISKEISEVLGSLKDNNVDDFIKLNDDQKHKSANFLTIINKFKSKLSNDDAEKLRNYLDGNLSTDDFKNTFSNKLDVSDDEYNALIISYCGINDINQVKVPPFKVANDSKMPLSFVSSFDKSKKISDLQNFTKIFGKISNHNDYELIKEFIQPTNSFQNLVSIFEKGLDAADLYDIWDKYFTDQVDFNSTTHKALTDLIKDNETLDISKFKSKKATVTFTEWLNSTDNAVICAIDKVGFTDGNGNAITVDNAKMKSALDKIKAVKTDPKLNKDNIVTFITNARYQDKLTKDHIEVLKDIFGTDFKTKVLNNAGYTKFSITIKDLADKIGNQSLTSSEVKTLFSTKCNDWDTEKVKADIVTRIGTVSNIKKLKHVFEVLSGADLTAANAVTIGKVCEKKGEANPVNDEKTLSEELVQANGGLNEFIASLKNDDKKIKTVFANGALGAGNTLAAKDAVTIAKACNKNSSNAASASLAELAAELATENDSRDAFLGALDGGEKKISKVFGAGALQGTNLTAANAAKIAIACNKEDASPVTNVAGLGAEFAAQPNSLNAFLGALVDKKFVTVFGALNGAGLSAANANAIFMNVSITNKDSGDIATAKTELLDALFDKKFVTVFAALKGAGLEAAHAKDIIGDCNTKTSVDIEGAKTEFLNALVDKKISTVFAALKGANLTAAHAATIAYQCSDVNNGSNGAGLAAAAADFIASLDGGQQTVAAVFGAGALNGKNLTAANAATIAVACSDGPTKNAGGTNLAAVAGDFIAAIKNDNNQEVKAVFEGLVAAGVTGASGLTAANAAKIAEACSDKPSNNGGNELATAAKAFIDAINTTDEQTVAKVFAGLVTAGVTNAQGLTAANAATIACAILNKLYNNDGKKELVTYLTKPENQDDLEYFFKALKKNDNNGDKMAGVSVALKGTANDYTLAQVLKILVHCSDFHTITNEIKNGPDSVALSKTNNKNRLDNLDLATVFAADNNVKNLGQDADGGQKMFTAWELARIIAKTTNRDITDVNAAKVLGCLQDAYRKLDIVFYELAYCKINSLGNYDFSDDGGPNVTDGNRGKLSREACFALAQACHKAGASTDALNYKDANTNQIFTNGRGGYSSNGTDQYLDTKDRHKDLWLNNGGATKKYGNTDVFPIIKLGTNDDKGDVSKDLYAIIGAVCTGKIGGADAGDIDFTKNNWDGHAA